MVGNLNVTDVVNVIRGEMKESTKKFVFFHMEEFPTIPRISGCDDCPIKKMHTLQLNGNHAIVQPWICLECTVGMVCDDCRNLKPAATINDATLGSDSLLLRDQIMNEQINPRSNGQ